MPTTDTDLAVVLIKLYDAGAVRIPAEETGWTSSMVPAINVALTMQYVTWRDTERGRTYSLTAAGYEAVGKEPRAASIREILSAIFRL